MDLMRAEKDSLAAELAEARSERLELQGELERLHQRCTAAEGSTDAISRVRSSV